MESMLFRQREFGAIIPSRHQKTPNHPLCHLPGFCFGAGMIELRLADPLEFLDVFGIEHDRTLSWEILEYNRLVTDLHLSDREEVRGRLGAMVSIRESTLIQGRRFPGNSIPQLGEIPRTNAFSQFLLRSRLAFEDDPATSPLVQMHL